MMKKMITLLTVMALSLTALAQTTTKSNDLVAFENIEINNDFEVIFHQADFYRVDWTIDTILKDVVSVYVSGKTLYVNFNKKGMSSELKKAYKGRNAPTPILKVSIYAPSFNTLTMTENAVFDAMGNKMTTGVFTLNLSDKARVSNFTVEANQATLVLEKDSQAALTLDARKIDIKASKSAVLDLMQTSEGMNITASGSAAVTISGRSEKITTSTQNSSKVAISGTAESLKHDGKGNSEVDMVNVPLKRAEVTMNSGKINLSVSDQMNIDLKGGASVYYNGSPSFDTINIVSSTLTRYTGKK